MVSLKDRLTEILIKNKLITQEQLNQAIQIQSKKGGRLSEIIIDLKLIKENELISALSEGLSFPPIDLKRFKIDPEIVKIIPHNIARHYQIIPISKIGNIITLVMADPLKVRVIGVVHFVLGVLVLDDDSHILQATALGE
jgi:type IV pilus assembly protein PilB